MSDQRLVPTKFRFPTAGEEMFHPLRSAAVTFDQRLRAEISEADLAGFEQVPEGIVRHVGDGGEREGAQPRDATD